MQVDKCDAEVRLTVEADGQQACKPTQSVKEALAKLDGLLQSWRAAVQDTQVHVTHFLPKLQQVAHLKPLEKKRKEYAFRRQFIEKPSIIPGCPVPQAITYW